MDRELFQTLQHDFPSPLLHLPPAIHDSMHDLTLLTTRFFSWVHLWLPIIDKSSLQSQLAKQPLHLNQDVQILLFCMKLVMWAPGRDGTTRNPRTNEYHLAKQCCSAAEDAGMLTLQMLQAQILVSVYELAHGIYPAAYLTVGTCVRYGIALTLNKQRSTDVQGFTLADQEERRRVWWSSIILDRVISHSTPTGPDPQPSDLLPLHDREWDEGRLNAQPSTVSAPSDVNMGMFARLSQAAYLMGRVVHHREHPTGDTSFDTDEAVRLDGALRALLNLTYEEGATRLMQICPQTAICFSALIKLHARPLRPQNETHELDNDYRHHNRIADTMRLLRAVADQSTLSTVLFFRREPWSIEKSSPFLLHWTYVIAVTYLDARNYLEQQAGSPDYYNGREDALALMHEADQGYETMRRKLALLGAQWCAADGYLQMLDVRASWTGLVS